MSKKFQKEWKYPRERREREMTLTMKMTKPVSTVTSVWSRETLYRPITLRPIDQSTALVRREKEKRPSKLTRRIFTP